MGGWHDQERCPRKPEGWSLACRGQQRPPTESLAPGPAGWGLLRKWTVAAVLSPWGMQVPGQVFMALSLPRCGLGCQSLFSCHCSWNLLLHPEAGVGTFSGLNRQQPHPPGLGVTQERGQCTEAPATQTLEPALDLRPPPVTWVHSGFSAPGTGSTWLPRQLAGGWGPVRPAGTGLMFN